MPCNECCVKYCSHRRKNNLTYRTQLDGNGFELNKMDEMIMLHLYNRDSDNFGVIFLVRLLIIILRIIT